MTNSIISSVSIPEQDESTARTVPTSGIPSGTLSWQPRTSPRPTDQRSGELKEPALSNFLADTVDADSTDIPFSPVPPDPPLCPYCHKPIRLEDIASISALASDHGLPASLCLNCTLAELEVLSPFTEVGDGMPVVFASLLAA